MKAFINCVGGPQEVDIVDICKVGGYTFFIHKYGNGYVASEWHSGFRINAKGDSNFDYYDSIEKTKAMIKNVYATVKKTKFTSVIELSKINHGIVNEGNPPTRKQVLEDVREGI
jgi:hypothetical protein